MMVNERRHLLVLGICVILTTIIFALDLCVPLGVAAAVPYAVVILVALQVPDNNRIALGFAVITSVLTVVGYFLSEPAGTPWMIFANRLVAVVVIWFTFCLAKRLKQAKTELESSEQRFEQLATQSPLIFWQTDKTGNWIYCSDGWHQFTGTIAADNLNNGWLQQFHSEEQALLADKMTEAISRQDSFQTECRVKTVSGDFHWIALEVNPLFDNLNNFTGLIGTGLDIQAHKATARLLEETRRKYYQQEKMASIGTLASGILHEIGNPLASILGLLNEVDDLNKNAPNEKNTQAHIENNLAMVFDELNRLTRISQDVRSFATMPVDEKCLVNLNDLIGKTARLMQHDERMFSAKLSLQLDKNLPAVCLTSDHFIQVLQNLLSNAIDACSSNSNEAQLMIHSSFDDLNIYVSVSDNGIGMSNELLARIGEEFYTTKEKGTGLGLSLCKSLIEEMHGTLAIDSTVNQGTVATITIPFKE